MYVYNPQATSDSGLAAPINPGGQGSGLSNITFCWNEVDMPEDEYFFQFDKEWEGDTDQVDLDAVEVTFVADNGFEWTLGEDGPVEVTPGGTTLTNVDEEVVGLPEQCSVTDTTSVVGGFPLATLTAPEDVDLYDENNTFTLVVTNTVSCDEGPNVASFSVAKVVNGDRPIDAFEFSWECREYMAYREHLSVDVMELNGYIDSHIVGGGDFSLRHGEMIESGNLEFEGKKLSCIVTEEETRDADTVSNNQDGEEVAQFTLKDGDNLSVVFTNTFEGDVLGDDDKKEDEQPEEERERETGDVLGAAAQVDAPVGAVLAGGGGAAGSSSNALAGLLASLGLIGAGVFARRWTL